MSKGSSSILEAVGGKLKSELVRELELTTEVSGCLLIGEVRLFMNW